MCFSRISLKSKRRDLVNVIPFEPESEHRTFVFAFAKISSQTLDRGQETFRFLDFTGFQCTGQCFSRCCLSRARCNFCGIGNRKHGLQCTVLQRGSDFVLRCCFLECTDYLESKAQYLLAQTEIRHTFRQIRGTRGRWFWFFLANHFPFLPLAFLRCTGIIGHNTPRQ